MSKPPSRWLLVAAFAAIYLIWGSSYIGIHYAIETLPPFLMAGIRFVLAGAILIGWALWRGAPLPTRVQWRSAAIAGGFLFLVNNAAIVWAENRGMPTGITAVLVGTIPMWMVLMAWLRPGGSFPGFVVIGGLVLGMVGVVLLVGVGDGSANLLEAAVLLVAAVSWSFGSLYAKSAPLPDSAPLSTGMQLFCGGLLLLPLSLVTGDMASFHPAQVSATSLLALVYLALASSVIAFSAFVWLMRVVSPARVSTYAYVNPVVAVALGWLLAGEQITARTLVGAGIIIASVILINLAKNKALPRLRRVRVAEATP